MMPKIVSEIDLRHSATADQLREPILITGNDARQIRKPCITIRRLCGWDNACEALRGWSVEECQFGCWRNTSCQQLHDLGAKRLILTTSPPQKRLALHLGTIERLVDQFAYRAPTARAQVLLEYRARGRPMFPGVPRHVNCSTTC